MPDVLLSVAYPYLPPPVEGPPDDLTDEAKFTLAFQAELVRQIVVALKAIDGDEYDAATEITVGGGFTPYWHHNRRDYEIIFFAPSAPGPGHGEHGLPLSPPEAQRRRARFAELITEGLVSFMNDRCSRDPYLIRPTFAIAVMLLDSSGGSVSKGGIVEDWWGCPAEH